MDEPSPPGAARPLDPLSQDAADDELVLTTRRGLVRLALVASETGCRFERERIPHDPMAWLLAPRRLFRGSSALDSVLGRDDCLRAVMLHRLGLGFDADASDIDELVREDGDPALDLVEASVARGGGMRLFTATLAGEDKSANQVVLAFEALVCGSATELRDRILRRVGPNLAASAVVREGFDASEPVAMALVSGALADQLAHVEAAPTSALATGLDVVLQQSFAA